MNTGEQAFPGPSDGYNGMWLRDWFAGQALAGLVVGCAGQMATKEFSAYAHGGCNQALADRAWALAEMMLLRREVEQYRTSQEARDEH